MGLGKQLDDGLPYLPGLGRLGGHVTGQQLLLVGGQAIKDLRLRQVIINRLEGSIRILRLPQGSAKPLQRRNQGLAGLLHRRAFRRRSPGKRGEPSLAPNAVSDDIVFQLPSVLLFQGRIARFEQDEHILGRISLRHSPQGSEQKAGRAVGGGGKLAGHIGRNPIGGKHR